MRKKLTLLLIFICLCNITIASTGDDSYVIRRQSKGAFMIADKGQMTAIVVDANDMTGVVRAANDLADDIGKVTGNKAAVSHDITNTKGAILIGTIGSSRIIDRLVSDGKIDVKDIEGKWEAFSIQTIDGNLVIIGSDRRGTMYGIYDLSEKIGVSPWYWWADVPARKGDCLYVKADTHIHDAPKVKYRGIFINDENPSFGDWARAHYGGEEKTNGYNREMYPHMFELILRLKGNYLWPAMWGKAFNEDDPMNPVLANEYGIIMGTSHHEPMMRAQLEYTDRRRQIGAWDYVTNSQNLLKFWHEGIERNKNYDNMITIGMRGDGDVAMGKGDDASNIKVLEGVLRDQRNIITEVYGKDASEVPQMWALFTEVQRYYDAGMESPEDVLLMFCDNNWGYIRRTGPAKEQNRKGGMGMYYHIDMNGGPWNDRWINTTTIPKLREQFNLAYRTGIDDLWIINVGDLKPKELPIDFIMRYAWNPDAYPAESTWDYTVEWARRNFGDEHAEEIAEIVTKYPKYNLMRKPEVQNPRIFSYVNYHESERVIAMWREVAEKAEKLENSIAPEARDAYYQLVLYPAKASAGVAEMYLSVGMNNLYAQQGRVSANDYAQHARELLELDQKLSDRYNNDLADGKWTGMMSDVHIGYTICAMPRRNALPSMTEVTPLDKPTMGVAVEGDEKAFTLPGQMAALPAFDVLKKCNYYIDIFNRGVGTFTYTVSSDNSWIKLSSISGTVDKEERIFAEIDWRKVPKGESAGRIIVSGSGIEIPIAVSVVNNPLPKTRKTYFGNFTGEFSIPAQEYSANIAGKNTKWKLLPDLGRGEACMGAEDVTVESATTQSAARLEYRIFLPKAGETKVCIGILPTQDVNPARGLRIAVAMDDQQPVILDARKGFVDTYEEYTPKSLALSKTLKPLPELGEDYALVSRRSNPRRNEVFDDLRWIDVKLNVDKEGLHTLKVYMIDPEIVLENIVVNPDDNHQSYFGAPPIRHSK